MKHIFYPLFSLAMIIFFLLTACTGLIPGAPASDLPEAVEPAGQAQVTEMPATEIAIETVPTLETVSLAGPPMEVGSKYLYVDGNTLVAVPAGEFEMGNNVGDNLVHTVFLDDFWIYRMPVTNQQYAMCVNAGICDLPDLETNLAYDDRTRVNDPVVGVTWDQATAYCSFVGARLPSEAEWEKTARGPDGNIYPWGNLEPTCDLVNAGDCEEKTTDVTQYPQGASYYDALDMAGNVFEWLADWYSPSYYGISPAENPVGPETGTRRSVRSSGFSTAFFEADVSRRSSSNPPDYRADLGFRCAVDDPLYFAPNCKLGAIYGYDASTYLPLPDSASLSCPTFSIQQAHWCDDFNGEWTNVTFDVNPPGTEVSVEASSCAFQGGGIYMCNAQNPVTVCANCDITLDADLSCPSGYTRAGVTCVVELGFSGECLPGNTYDQNIGCCRAPFSEGESIPLCPTGTYYSDPPSACVPIPTTGFVCASDTVELKSCGESSGDDLTDEISCSEGQNKICPTGLPCFCVDP